jgi:hypothetical protein
MAGPNVSSGNVAGPTIDTGTGAAGGAFYVPVQWDSTNNVFIVGGSAISASVVINVSNLPTLLPATAGILWNDDGVLSIS